MRQELKHTGQLIANQLAPATEYGIMSGNNDVLETLINASLNIPRMFNSCRYRTGPTTPAGAEHPAPNADKSSQVEVFQAPVRVQKSPSGGYLLLGNRQAAD